MTSTATVSRKEFTSGSGLKALDTEKVELSSAVPGTLSEFSRSLRRNGNVLNHSYGIIMVGNRNSCVCDRPDLFIMRCNPQNVCQGPQGSKSLLRGDPP